MERRGGGGGAPMAAVEEYRQVLAARWPTGWALSGAQANVALAGIRPPRRLRARAARPRVPVRVIRRAGSELRGAAAGKAGPLSWW